jgi:GT2 family glycosyltransferase
MGYGLRTLDLCDLPPRLTPDPGESGLGVILRDRGRIVGFKLIDEKAFAAGEGIEPARLIDREVREAVTIRRLRDEMGAPAASAPSITVAICSKDRWDWVDRLLTSLGPLRAEGEFDVVVIDNASSDDRMREVCGKRDWVRYFHEPLVGLNFARNRAIREARGEVVAFLDDDVIVDSDWLKGLRRAWAENPDAGCVTGLVLPMALETEAQILFEAGGGFRRGFRPIRYGAERYGDQLYPCGAGRFGAGANMSLRRDLVRRLGGFDEALDTGRPLPGGGDLDIFYRVLRAGATLVYEPQAAVYHEHRRDMAVLRRQYYTWGVGFMAYWGHVPRGYTQDELDALFGAPAELAVSFINPLLALSHDVSFSRLSRRRRKLLHALLAPVSVLGWLAHGRRTRGTEIAAAWRKSG